VTPYRIKQDFNKAKRIFTFFKPYWKLWGFLFFISLILKGLSLINPLIVKFLIDDVLIVRDFELLRTLMFFFIGITLFATAASVISGYFYKKLELSILYDVRNKLFEKLEQLRALENGMRIDAARVDTVPFGVDTQEDLDRARQILSRLLEKTS